MHPYTKEVINTFKKYSDADTAIAMKQYMRNQFEFFGIPSPQRKEIIQSLLKKQSLSIAELETVVKELYYEPHRELHYFAIELVKSKKKIWNRDVMNLFEFMILNKSWWDSVDTINSYLLSPYFKLFPDTIQITHRWNKSDNIWLQRLSVIFQLSSKLTTDTSLMFKHILYLKSSKEFFVQKAIGWMLRQHAKFDAELIKKFVHDNQDLAPLSKREALKNISK
jgi:3-methyladenine DNA glycosylase AlkD